MKENYSKISKEFGCLFHVNRFGIKLFPKDPLGNIYKLFQIIPLDGWITDKHEIIQAMLDDPLFEVKINQNGDKR